MPGGSTRIINPVSGDRGHDGDVLDRVVRQAKDRLLTAVAASALTRLRPMYVTAASLVVCLAAAAIAATTFGGDVSWRWRVAAVTLWMFGRFLDAVDGSVARARQQASDLGGYVDMMVDTVGYAAVPLGIALGRSTEAVWAMTAVLLATFYLNTLSWTYLAAVAEKRQARSADLLTSIEMPAGLIEGVESAVLFSVMLLWPQQAVWWCGLMAALVVITIAQRVVWAWRTLS
jgi:phosphatidylglycerophosphate synthase